MRFFRFNSDRYATPRPYGVEAIFHPLRLDVASFAAKRGKRPRFPKLGTNPIGQVAAVASRPLAVLAAAFGQWVNFTPTASCEARWPRLARDKVANVIGLPIRLHRKQPIGFAQTNHLSVQRLPAVAATSHKQRVHPSTAVRVRRSRPAARVIVRRSKWLWKATIRCGPRIGTSSGQRIAFLRTLETRHWYALISYRTRRAL
jgi:hypothetical protein